MNSWRQYKIQIIFAGVFALVFLGFTMLSSKKTESIEVKLTNLQSIAPNEKVSPVTPGSARHFIVHFWASWCGPCQAEMPSIYAAVSKLPTTAKLIVIAEDDKAEDALNFMHKFSAQPGVDFKYWDGDKSVSRQLSVTAFPETWIFDSNLRLERKITGSMIWTDPENLQYLQSL